MFGILPFAASSMLLAGAAEAQSGRFFCGEDSFVTVTEIDKNTIRAGLIDGQTLTMRRSQQNPSTFFSGEYDLTVFPSEQRIEIMIPDYGSTGCELRQSRIGGTPAVQDNSNAGGEFTGFPVDAQSWGGVVRAGPGTEFERADALPEGQRITILGQADAPFYQDRPWFRIQYGDATGYHWGGIICPKGFAVPGTYKVC